MTPEERENEGREIERLCLAVISEKDPDKLTKLVEALNGLLERTHQSNKTGAA